MPLLSGVLAAALLLAACAPATQPTASQPPAATSGQAAAQSGQKTRLTVVYGVDVDAWNPYGHSGTTVYAQWMHVMEPLVVRDNVNGGVAPLLAESWSNPDEKTWEFKLRRGVKFHDGTEFTAEDVVHSYGRIINDPGSKQGSALADVDDIVAVDPYTVRVSTKTPDAAFLERISNRVMSSKAHFERYGEEGDKQPIGTGPYKFKEWVQGQRWVVEKNPDYWGPIEPAYDEVIFRPIKEQEAAVTALLNGEADIVSNLPPQAVARLQSSGVARVEGAPGQTLMFLAMNPAYKPWDNKLLRQAVAYAIDREALVQGVLGGHGSVLKTPVGPGMYGYDPELQPQYEYDPEKAKQRLAEAGYPDGIDVEFATPVGRYNKDKEISEAIVGMLAKVGIRAKLQTPEWSKFWGDVQAGQQAFYMIGRGTVSDPSEYLQQYFRTGVTQRLSYSNPETDRLLLAQQQAFDPQERVKLLHQAMSQIMDDAPAAFLFQYEDLYGVSNKVDWKARTDLYVFGWEAKPRP